MKKILLSLSLVLLAHNVLFTQSCEPYSVPLTEDFQTDIHTELPECWSRITSGWATVRTSYPMNEPPAYCFLDARLGKAYLISPELDQPLGSLSMVFTSSFRSVGNIILEIGSMSNPADMTTYSSMLQLSVPDEPETRMIYFDELSGNDSFIVFRLVSETDADWGIWEIYDVLIESIPECPAPAYFFTGEITPSSVEIGWDQSGDIQAWDMVYGEPGFDPESEGTLIEDLNEPRYVITGLKSNSLYHLRVRAKCDGEAGQWSPYYSFKSGCGEYEIPFSESFMSEKWPANLPDCWSKLEYGDVMIENYSDWAGLNLSSPGTAFLITPRLASPPGGFRMELKAEHSNFENNIVLRIGSMSEPDDTSTFKQLTEVLLTTGYETYTVYFDDEFPGHIAFRADFEGMVVGDQIRIDELTVDNIPECTAPWNLTADEIIPATVRLGWTQPGNINEWDVIFGAYGFDPEFDGTLIENLQEPSYLVEDLSYGTKYQFRVRAVCNGEKNLWSAPFSFTTGCEPYGIPLFEDFLEIPNNDLPACWNKIEDGMASVSTFYYCADLSVQHGSAYLITPELDRPLQELRLKFSFSVWQKNEGILNVGTMTDPADLTTFNPIQQIELPWSHEENEVTVYFHESPGNDSHIAFLLSQEDPYWGSGVHILNVLIEELSECHEPLDLSAREITDISAALIWKHTKEVNDWEIAYGCPGTDDVPGFDPENEGTLIGGITEKSFMVTELEPGRHYQFYVRAVCNGEPGEWSLPLTLVTECGPVNTPFSENFHHIINQLPYCWDRIEEGTAEVYAGRNILKMYSRDGSGYLVTPEIRHPLSGLRLVINARKTEGTSLIFQVGSMADPSDKTTFSLLTEIGLSTQFETYLFQFEDYPSDNRHIAFRIVSTDYYPGFIEIDFIEVGDISDCLKPWDLSSLNVHYSSTRVSWNDFDDIEKWDVAWGSPGFNPERKGTIIEDISEKSYVIEGLESSTVYQFYVRGKCSGAAGEWSGPHDFLTRCAPHDLPLNEGFDGNDMPLCWTVVNASIEWYYSMDDFDRGLKLQHFSGKPSFLVSPHISTGLQSIRVIFKALRYDKMTGGGNSELVLGTMGNPDDATTFTAFTSVFVMDEKESGLQEFVVWFDTYEGNDQFIAFKLGNELYPDWYSAKMLIDDIYIDVIPQCPEPWNISAAGITQTSAAISWSQVGNAEKWNLAFGNAGFNPDTEGSLVEGISEKSFEINALEPGTLYQVYARAHCGDNTGNWSIPYAFSTECEAFDIRFSESFNNGLLPQCWSVTPSREMDFVRWEVPWSSSQVMSTFTKGEGVSRLITPPIDFSPALSANLQFGHHYGSYMEGEVVLKIQTSRDKVNWVDEDFRLEAGNSIIFADKVDVPVSNISENTYIAWVIEQPTNFGNWSIENVKITYEPATPNVEWPTAGAVIYGDRLYEAVLEGGRAWHEQYNVTGTFVFNDQNTILPAGENHQVAVTFLPDKGYNHVEGLVNITVIKADPVVTWPVSGSIKEGEPLSECLLSGGSANHKSVAVPGKFIFPDPEIIPPEGEYLADIIFVPDDQDNYNEVSGTVIITVTGPTQSDIVPGGGLSAVQVFPNPFTSGITLLNAREARRIKMTDVIGQVVIDVMLTGSETETIRTAHLPAGVYILTIYGENEGTRIIRMVRTR
jgi:hypothetical protein